MLDINTHFYFFRLILMVIACTGAALPCNAQSQDEIPQDRSAAVIFAYHRIGEDLYPATNIRREQFEEHLRELTSGAYHILPLPRIVSALKDNERLPENSVALTFDGVHNSAMEYAIPLLVKKEIPFTLFVPTDHLDSHSPRYMNWHEIKKLSRHNFITFGLHPASYTRLMDQPDDEIKRQINKARSRFREETGKEITLFAYPFGEHSAAYKKIVKDMDFTAAFGQQSGVAYAGSDLYALPRFSLTEGHGGTERFRLTARALPLPLSDIVPDDPYLKNAMPDIGFTFDETLAGKIDKLSCFVSGQPLPAIERVGARRVELRLARPVEDERTRINCTLPVTTDEDDTVRWRWFGMLLTLPQSMMTSPEPDEDAEEITEEN